MTATTTLFRPTLTTFGDIVPSVALSVVLPCYRAPGLARSSVTRLISAFAGRIPSYEIIVVDDGIGDCEPVLRDLVAPQSGSLRVITLPENRGKGGAVAAGMKAATGQVRIYTDVDIPYGTTPVMLVESLIRNRGFHMVTGDRTFPQSRYETELSFGRRMASRVFSKITATLVTGGFFDTQCGLSVA
jgi:dolichyl-phosphate beta-glucosyltransferase